MDSLKGFDGRGNYIDRDPSPSSADRDQVKSLKVFPKAILLEEFIRSEAEKLQYELVDVSYKGNKGVLVEVVVDRKGGITLDECSAFNKRISLWIDNTGMGNSVYAIDVCSPGLDRSLKTSGDFVWACGKKVEIRMHKPVGDKNEIVGRLLKDDGENRVVIEQADGTAITVDKDNIAKASLADVIKPKYGAMK